MTGSEKLFNILVVGVGGQGVVSISNVLAQAGFNAGLDVKKSETRGMAQQGGTVISHIRFGDDVGCVLTPPGGADLLIALEPLEALRHIEYLNHNGNLVVNSNPIRIPGYPNLNDLKAELEQQDAEIIDALDLAKKAGHTVTQNTILTGACAKHLPFDERYLVDAVKKIFTKKLGENMKAYELGKTI